MTSEKLRENLKNGFKLLEKYERLVNQKMDAWEADPGNEDREAALDQAYELEFNAYVWLIHLLTEYVEVDETTAKKMINTKREEMKAIL